MWSRPLRRITCSSADHDGRSAGIPDGILIPGYLLKCVSSSDHEPGDARDVGATEDQRGIGHGLIEHRPAAPRRRSRNE
jgi:hypothetical protein